MTLKTDVFMRKIFFPVLALVPAFCLLSAVCCSPALAGIGTVNKGGGAIYFKAKGAKSWIIATAGMDIDEGGRVKSGSDGRIEISLQDGSRLAVGNNTEVEITRFLLDKGKRNGTIFLVRGKLRAIIAKFSGRTNMRVKTPTVGAGIKGAAFIIMNQGKANVLFGQEGSVVVIGKDQESVALLPNTMTENTQGHAPIPPVKVGIVPQLSEARKQLEALTDVEAPVEWEAAGNLPAVLARWNINYGHYLTDSGRYRDALEVFQIAMDLTDAPEIGAEGHFLRGAIFFRNLALPQEALKEYQAALDRYPRTTQAEDAVFSIGMIYKDIGERERAKEYLRMYLKQYPQGKYTSTAETLLKEIE